MTATGAAAVSPLWAFEGFVSEQELEGLLSARMEGIAATERRFPFIFNGVEGGMEKAPRDSFHTL